MTPFGEHFPLVEWQRASDVPLSSTDREYAAQLSQRLEQFRAAFGDRPIVVTSFVRRRTSDTQHGEATAVDVRLPVGITEREAVATAKQLETAGLKWGQLIFYPWAERHMHISLPTGQARQAILVQLPDRSYTELTPALFATFPTSPARPDLVELAAENVGAAGLVLIALGVALALGS